MQLEELPAFKSSTDFNDGCTSLSEQLVLALSV